jgi:hypothetical protein
MIAIYEDNDDIDEDNDGNDEYKNGNADEDYDGVLRYSFMQKEQHVQIYIFNIRCVHVLQYCVVMAELR